MLTSAARYFFLPEPKVGCHPAVFWLGAAAMVLIFSFLGFLVSRLPFCSPLAMSISLGYVAGFVDDAVIECRISHRRIARRTFQRAVDLVGQFGFADLMKRGSHRRRLDRAHGKRFAGLIAEFDAPNSA